MAAATAAPVRERTPHAVTAVPLSTARLLLVELRRNTMPWILPLIAALFWFDSYRPSTATAALFGTRTFWNMGQGHTIIDFGPFVAGVAAWMASREGRRGLTDLVTTTARPRWAAQLTTWAATAIWAVAAYLVFVGVMFAAYARQGVGGSPPWWSVLVGVVAVAAFCAAGFAIGAYWPSRFAAPVAAFGGFLAMAMSSKTGFNDPAGWAQILPTNSNGNFDGNAMADSGVFYRWLPDVPIARVIFLAGITIALLGVTGVAARAGGRRLRLTAAILTIAGVAAAGTGVELASSARLSVHGMVIPSLHDAADDTPIAYTPVCGKSAGIQVCLNPAYHRWLNSVDAALAPVLTQLAGLPGAPARAAQVAAAFNSGHGGPPEVLSLGGSPAVLRLQLGDLDMPGPCGFCGGPLPVSQFGGMLRVLAVQAFLGMRHGSGSVVQQAVQAALLREAGMPFAAQPTFVDSLKNGPGPSAGPATGPAYAAAAKFVKLPATARHAWLAAHLTQVRAGKLALKDLP